MANGATAVPRADVQLDNERELSGGGVWCASTNSTLTNCVLTGNSALGDGGGASASTLYQCVLTGNSVAPFPDHQSYGGGGVNFCWAYNCVLAGNSADRGGGAAESQLSHCALVSNSGYDGGGVLGGSLTDCIVYFNRATTNANFSLASFDHSCSTPLPSGSGNIGADPLFVDVDLGELGLRPDSPCIDAGADITNLITTDLAGLPRALDGNSDRIATADMGAYEFNPYRFEGATQMTLDGLDLTILGEPERMVRIDSRVNLVNWDPLT